MSKAESKLGVSEYGIYRNKKNGKLYAVRGFAISSTNGDHCGEVLVRYRRIPDGLCDFARLESEFVEKFDYVEEQPLGQGGVFLA